MQCSVFSPQWLLYQLLPDKNSNVRAALYIASNDVSFFQVIQAFNFAVQLIGSCNCYKNHIGRKVQFTVWPITVSVPKFGRNSAYCPIIPAYQLLSYENTVHVITYFSQTECCKTPLQPNFKGQVIRATFSFNLSRNIVALQVEMRCCPCYYRVLNLPRNKFQCCKLQQHVTQSRTESSPCNTDSCCVTNEPSVVTRATTHFQFSMQKCCATSWTKMLPVLLDLKGGGERKFVEDVKAQ